MDMKCFACNIGLPFHCYSYDSIVTDGQFVKQSDTTKWYYFIVTLRKYRIKR